MTRRMASRSVTLTAGFVALAMGGAAACDVDTEEDYREEERRYHCAVEVNGQEEVVDCDDIQEDSSGGGFIYVGGYSHPVYIHSLPASHSQAYRPGTKLPPGGYRIGYSDANGRQRAGLPPRGPVANNTVKTSVVGKGGAPAPAGAKAGG